MPRIECFHKFSDYTLLSEQYNMILSTRSERERERECERKCRGINSNKNTYEKKKSFHILKVNYFYEHIPLNSFYCFYENPIKRPV